MAHSSKQQQQNNAKEIVFEHHRGDFIRKLLDDRHFLKISDTKH